MTIKTESIVLEMIDFVTRIATSESRVWTLTIETKVMRRQAEDIHRRLTADASPSSEPAPFNWCPEHHAYDEHGR